MRKFRHLIYLVLLIALDQLTKVWVRSTLDGGNDITIIPRTLKLTFHKNSGAIWGIFQDRITFLIIFTIIAMILLVFLYLKTPDTKKYIPVKLIFVFIIAGAIGNLIDRIFFGYVTDFIYFELIDFPVFNIADCYVSVSAFLFIILGLFFYKEEDLNCYSIRKKKDKVNDDVTREEE